MTESAATPFWRMQGVSKHYGGVTALSNVDFTCERGVIHAVLGENGAGKSTLIKIIAGAVQPSAGKLFLEGREVSFPTPEDATRNGVVSVFQELSLMPDLTVADNICITAPPTRWGIIDGRAQRRRAEALLARVGCADVHPRELVKNLALSRRQMVEIAKAMGRKPKVLDPRRSDLCAHGRGRRPRYTAMLAPACASRVLRSSTYRTVCMKLKRWPMCAPFSATARHIETFDKGKHSNDEIVQLMIGRVLQSSVYPPRPEAQARNGGGASSARPRSCRGAIVCVIFRSRSAKARYVGLGGLDGQGQKELLLALFGVLRGVGGSLSSIEGKNSSHITSPRKSPSRKRARHGADS